MYNPNKKAPNQNLFDFVIQNYGSLDGLIPFLKTQSTTTEFASKDIGMVIKTPESTPNANKNSIQGNQITIATGEGKEYISNDYNNDYNIDFFI